MQNEIVVARYAEDVDWVKDIPDGFTVTIYNKGADIESGPALERADQIIRLANGGRESDTILRHILNKRDVSAGHTVFLQGDPFEHSPDIITLLNAAHLWDDLQPLSWRWLVSKDLPPSEILSREQSCFIGEARVRPETFSLMNWEPMQFPDFGIRIVAEQYRSHHGLLAGANIAGHFLRQCEWTDLADQAEHHLAGRFSYGALFAVRQSLLSKIPRRSVELALEAANSHSMYGYVLERMWLHMFGEPFLLPALAAARHSDSITAAEGRFAPPAVRKPLPSRVIPAIKRRISAWAQT